MRLALANSRNCAAMGESMSGSPSVEGLALLRLDRRCKAVQRGGAVTGRLAESMPSQRELSTERLPVESILTVQMESQSSEAQAGVLVNPWRTSTCSIKGIVDVIRGPARIVSIRDRIKARIAFRAPAFEQFVDFQKSSPPFHNGTRTEKKDGPIVAFCASTVIGHAILEVARQQNVGLDVCTCDPRRSSPVSRRST